MSGPAGTTAALIVALIAGLAAASPVIGADAAQLIKEGVTLRRQGNDAEALRKFQQAFETDKSPRVLAQMGLAEQALGRWVAAYEHLNEALEAKNDGWIAKNRATINEALGVVGDHVGRIEILGAAAGAEVRIDGVPRGTLPLRGPLTLTTGNVTIDLSAAGFVPVQRTAIVRPRQTSREYFDALAPVSERAASASSTRAGGTGGVPTAASTTPTAVRKSELASGADGTGTTANTPSNSDGPSDGSESADTGGGGASPIRGAAKWVAWGLGAASAGLGVFGYVKQNAAADDFGKGCGVDPAGMIEPLPSSTTSLQRCRDLKGDVDSNFRLELIGFVGAAVLVGAGFALWLTEPSAGDGSSAAVACFPGLTAGGGMAVGCSFQL